MYKKHTLILLLLFVVMLNTNSFGQGISINETTDPPDASAILDVQSTDKGMLIPRMTTVQRTGILLPANGLLIYDTNTSSFWYRDAAGWVELTDNFHGLQDADHDTKIQVEESADEDRIRFDVGGLEAMMLERTSTGATRLEIGPSIGLIIGRDAGINSLPAWNTIIGYQAGQFSTTGERNVFLGFQAGQNNGVGQNQNVFLGYRAGQNNDATANTMVGYHSGRDNTTGYDNLFSGHEAGFNNQTGHNNTFLGKWTGYDNVDGLENTMVGSQAGFNSLSSYNTFVGTNAGFANQTGQYNSVIGMNAGGVNAGNSDLGDGNAILGYEAGYTAGGFAYNVLAGYRAGYSLMSGNYNVFVGNLAGHGVLNGRSNTAVGVEALSSNRDGNYNVAIGDSTLRNNLASGNVAVGSRAGMDNTVGHSNTFIGRFAGTRNTSGIRNTIVGNRAGQFNSEGKNNVFIGVEAAFSNSKGDDNTFIGYAAGFRNNAGNSNVFIGHRVAEFNIDGASNVAIGLMALNANSNGKNNIAIGELALGRLGGGSYIYSNNIGIGLKAGMNILGTNNIIVGNNSAIGISGTGHVVLGHDVNPRGTYNTYLGSSTGSILLSTADYSTAVGYGTQLKIPYSIIVGDNYEAKMKVGVGTNEPEARMHISGSKDSLILLAEGGFSRFMSTVTINTATPATGYELSVNGDIACEEVRVQDMGMWPDYVFEEQYHLPDLSDLSIYIKKHKHLPGIPSAEEVATDGVRLGDLQRRMLEKVEELTLYIIALENRIGELETQNK